MYRFRTFGPGLIFLTFVGIPAPEVHADDMQAWTSLAVQPRPASDEGWIFSFDAHARWRDDASQLGVTILRPAIGWRLNSKVDLWAGYADVDIHLRNTDISEQRTWQQATIQWGDVLGGQVSSRTRLEQRWRDTRDDTGYRLRQLVRWSRTIKDSNVSVIASNEVFAALDDADWGQRAGFDQNRAFVGLGVRLSSSVRLEAGYLNNLAQGSAGSSTNHAGSLALIVTP